MNEKKEEIKVEYDDIGIGTPIYAAPPGGFMVRVPIKKEEEIKFRQRINELKSSIKFLEDECRIYKKHLKWSARRKLKKGRLLL